jgi:hypothetical protein
MACALAMGAMVGCKSIGPSTVPRDRMHYSSAVAESWKEQLLLNIVKLRFADAPAFLEVASVVSGYTLETGVSLSGQVSPQSLRGDTFGGAGLSGRFTDRPTISYSPMTGERYARSLVAPVPLEMLMFFIQGGTPADFLLGLTAQCIQGCRNAGLFAGHVQPADPDFAKLLGLFRSLQQADLTETELTTEAGQVVAWIRFYPVDDVPAPMAEQVAEAKSMLGIPAHTDRVRVAFGSKHPAPDTIAIRTRSLLQILNTLGMGVQIPAGHPAQARALAVDTTFAPRGFTVHSGNEKPEGAFVAVPYEGLWFWIDAEDLATKSILSAVTILFNFLEGGGKESPVLTIPTN